MSVSAYSDSCFLRRLDQFVVSLSKVLNQYCFNRLSCEMSTRREHPREGCLLSAISYPKEIALTRLNNNMHLVMKIILILLIEN